MMRELGAARIALGAVFLSAVAPVWAQELHVVSVPSVGEEVTTPIGGDVHTYARIYKVDGYELQADTKAGYMFMEEKLPKGTRLVPAMMGASGGKIKACVPYKGEITAAGPCLIDDEPDGVFDRHSPDEVTLYRKLKAPVPYTTTPIAVEKDDSFRSVLIYQGATSDSFRFSYREFYGGVARPAFTEELLIPREPLPSMVMVKNLQLELLAVSGMGLTYRVVKIAR